MSKTFKLLILTTFLLFFSSFISQEAQATSCANVPLSGDYTVTTSCAFSGTVNGIENGNLIIESGQTLTINNGQTIIWNPGKSVLIQGSIAINAGIPGGQLRKAFIYLKDEDDNGYPSLIYGMVVGRSSSVPPVTGGKRRGHEDFTSKWTKISDIIYERCDGVASGEVEPGMTALSCSVATSCASTTVLRLSSTDNAHAELPAQANYSQYVCCSGGPGLATATTTDMEIPDTVLRLSSTTNAHVEKDTEANYADSVILTISWTEGAIWCKYDTSCSSPYTCLASISGDTNAHLGNCSAYATKVCCANVCP